MTIATAATYVAEVDTLDGQDAAAVERAQRHRHQIADRCDQDRRVE
jgi:hypothetical protein